MVDGLTVTGILECPSELRAPFFELKGLVLAGGNPPIDLVNTFFIAEAGSPIKNFYFVITQNCQTFWR